MRPLINQSKRALFENFKVKNTPTNQLLGSLNTADAARLQPYLEPVSLLLGQSLYQPQDRISYIYFPETAIISNLEMLEDGRTVEVALTGIEGVAGVLSLLNSQSASNWTEVVVAGKALRLNARILKQEFCGNQSLQSVLLGYINSYIEQLSQRAICNNYHQIKERFCSWLLMLQNRNQTDKFFLTHEQVARFLGVHRPGISHVAQELRQMKIIDYKRGQIIILNLVGLKQLACSCFCLN